MSKLIKTYDRYEVVKVPFPFVNIKSSKVRPALILSGAQSFNGKIGMSIMAMITSLKKDPKDLWPSDIEIEDLEDAGLMSPSLIRFKCFTLDHRLILDRLGILSGIDQKKGSTEIKRTLMWRITKN